MLEIAVRNPGSLRQDARRGDEPDCPPGCRSSAVRRAQRNEPASPDCDRRRKRRRCSSSLPPGGARPRRARALGEAAPGRLVKDRSDLDYLRVFASRPTVVGRTLGDLDLPGDKASISPPRSPRRHRPPCRGRTSCSSSAIASACSPIAAIFTAMRKFFGDSIKGTAEFSYISIGLGMALGFLLGAIQIPLPGIGKIARRIVGRADRGADPRATCAAPAA